MAQLALDQSYPDHPPKPEIGVETQLGAGVRK
jgi:hypothetical protein